MTENSGRIVPADWAKDSLSEFLDNAQHNVVAAFDNLRPEFERLGGINDAFLKITENLLNVEELIPSFFLFRSHSSYLGAVRLALSGQVPESYMVLRGCLENGLYAMHIYRNEGAWEIWFRRHDSAESLRQCKQTFRVLHIFETLTTESERLSQIARHLYETTIDYGGHPNEASLTSIMRKKEDGSSLNFTIPYLIDYRLNPEAFGLGLKSCARVGVCSLMIFRNIFRERFDILGLSDDLQRLQRGL